MNHDTLQAARRLQRQVEDQRARRRGAKDAVLHLRIEKEVMDRIKSEARLRKLSISDLVRACLSEHFPKAAETNGQPEFLQATYAWSDAVVMRDSPCAVCGAPLARGTSARLANGPPPPARLVCGPCYDAIQQDLDAAIEDNQLPAEEGSE